MAKIKVSLAGQMFVATVTNAQEAIVVADQARKLGYQENIVNVNFKPNLGPEGGNTPTIPNPMSKEDFICNKILDNMLVGGKQLKREEIQRVKVPVQTAEIEADVATAFAGITIVKDVATPP